MSTDQWLLRLQVASCRLKVQPSQNKDCESGNDQGEEGDERQRVCLSVNLVFISGAYEGQIFRDSKQDGDGRKDGDNDRSQQRVTRNK